MAAVQDERHAAMTDRERDTIFQRELVKLIPHLRAFARTLTGDATQADDLAQDAMIKAWDARKSFQLGTNMKAWTFMILRNQFYSDKRRSWRQIQLDQEAAERTLVAASHEGLINPAARMYINRLSDFLFVLARRINNGDDPLWVPGASR